MKIIKPILLSILLLVAVIRANAQTATVNNIVADYLDVKNALVAGDGAVAETKAKALYAQVSMVSVNDMTPAQQSVWKNYVDKLSFDSRHISETNFIDHQREHFSSLSQSMYAVLKAFKTNDITIYWQYCPMKKVSWLSEKPTIENPYYGKEMLDCGSTKETLKAAK